MPIVLPGNTAHRPPYPTRFPTVSGRRPVSAAPAERPLSTDTVEKVRILWAGERLIRAAAQCRNKRLPSELISIPILPPAVGQASFSTQSTLLGHSASHSERLF